MKLYESMIVFSKIYSCRTSVERAGGAGITSHPGSHHSRPKNPNHDITLLASWGCASGSAFLQMEYDKISRPGFEFVIFFLSFWVFPELSIPLNHYIVCL